MVRDQLCFHSHPYCHIPELPELWLFEQEYAHCLQRIKVRIHGTRHDNYLNGDYEGKEGRILGATRASGEFEQTAMVAFDSSEEPRSIMVRYIVTIQPSYMGEDVLILDGKDKGKVVVVREKPDDNGYAPVTVSTRAAPTSVFEVSKDRLATLYEEASS